MKIKYTILSIIILYTAFMAPYKLCAQYVNAADDKVPTVVKQSLQTLYPGATNIEWFKVKRNHEAEFVIDNKSMSILFEKNGNVVNQKQEIDPTQYPAIVSENLKNAYIDKGYKPLSYMMRTEKDEIIYEILMVKGRELIVIKYNPSGKLLSDVQLAKTLPLDYFPTY